MVNNKPQTTWLQTSQILKAIMAQLASKLSLTYFGVVSDLISDKLYMAPGSSFHFLQALQQRPAES